MRPKWRLLPKCAIIENGQEGTPEASYFGRCVAWWRARRQAGLWPLPYETGVLLEPERRVLECLVAALVSEWSNLSTDLQRKLFEHATSGKLRDAVLVKTRIARFLHDPKDDSGSH